jgi:hypothetical protein
LQADKDSLERREAEELEIELPGGRGIAEGRLERGAGEVGAFGKLMEGE